ETEEGAARAFYQVQTITSHGGFYETFMGDNGSLVISEVPQKGNWAYREAYAPDWEPLVREGLLLSEAPPIQKIETRNVFVDVRVTAEAGRWPLPVELAKPAHQPHLENFFEAIRKGIPLNCPAELAYETAVAVLKVNEAVKNKTLLRFHPEEFKA
ncbi:MAG: Gfo/Idh/MocA family protein, partial [Candidatus Saccharicenans sp.]